jgi:hypothetical protein
LDILPQGRVAIALVLNEKIKSKEIPIVFITQWGTDITKIQEAVEKTVKKAVDSGASRKSEDYHGVSIITIISERTVQQVAGQAGNTAEQNDISAAAMQLQPAETSYCFIDDCLIAADDIEVLRFIIAHIKGAASPTLADDGDYTASMTALGPYNDVDLYINIKQIIKTFIARDTTGRVQTAIVNLGLDNVASFGNSVGLGRRAGSSCCGKVFLKINGTKKGICKIAETELAALRTPKFIPASAYSLTVCNLNIKKAYEELYSVLYSFNPMTAAMMQTPLLPPSPDGQPGLQMKADVIDHLGSQIILSQSINKPASESTMPAESLFALAVNNRAGLEKSLSLLHSRLLASNNPDAKRELLGHTIYIVAPQFLLPFFGPGPAPMQTTPQTDVSKMPKPAFTITDTHLIIGTEPAVEQAIRTLSSSPDTSLETAKWFVSAKASLPSVVGLACLQDNESSAEFFWKILKDGSSTKTTGIAAGPNPGFIFPQIGVNFGLLPPFDSVRKYFGPSTLYGISKSDGFFFEFNYLNPAAAE